MSGEVSDAKFSIEFADDIADKRGVSGKASRELDLIDYINENGDGEITAKNKPLTNREILAGALESAAKPGKELEKLQEYKKNIKELNKKTYLLSKMKEEIKRLSFGKGNKDVARIAELKEKAAKIERSIKKNVKQGISPCFLFFYTIFSGSFFPPRMWKCRCFTVCAPSSPIFVIILYPFSRPRDAAILGIAANMSPIICELYSLILSAD